MKIEKHPNLKTCTVRNCVTLFLAVALLIINGNTFGDRIIGITIVTGTVGIGSTSTCHQTRGPFSSQFFVNTSVRNLLRSLEF